VAAFTEKPDRATATRYLEGGRHFWNSGIFAWRPSVVLEGLSRELPELSAAVERCAAAGEVGTSEFLKALKTTYEGAPSISIDYALMEKAKNVVVLPASFSWNDVGQWVSMRDLWPLDEAGNCHRGEVLALSSRDCVVYGPDRFTALLGVEDIIVVQTEDATLVCDAKRSQDVRLILEALQRKGREDLQ
jgi:mannose-1-phosphate guanylyltransferase